MAHNIFKMPFAGIYEMYVKKIERKGRTQDELKTVVFWLTGYSESELADCINKKISVEEFFNNFPQLNEKAALITGSICGYRIEEISDPLMKKIRYLDKLVDELAKGKTMDKILRK